MPRPKIGSAAVIAILLCALSAQAGPRERDSWYAFVEGAQRDGYQHVVVSRQEDGHFRYVVDARLLIDVFAKRQEITSRAEYVVTAAYQPVSFRWQTQMASGEISASGRVSGGILKITSTSPGGESHRDVGLSDFDLFSACTDDWLHDQPAGAASHEVRVLREQWWDVQPLQLTRGEASDTGQAWILDQGAGQVRGTVVYDEQGELLEVRLDVPKLHFDRCSAEQAHEIDYLVADGPSLLTFPLDRPIAALHRLTSLTVRLRWTGIPFEQFNLQDARQRILDQQQEGDRYTVLLRVEEPAVAELDAAYPVGDPELARYLGETDFLKPRDEAIVAAAQQVVRDHKTARQAVAALSAWVFDTVETSMIAETLTGPQVLQRKKGKCTEYATLFASLARSVGIPTRIVLGERMVPGHWAGHMWNEAYVGQWITVDASANEVGGSHALLKLVHSETVAGTQPLRWALTESLEISIEDYQQTPSSLADKYETGVVGRVYTNVDYACRLTMPHDTWTADVQSDSGGSLVVRFRVPGADDVNIHFVAFGLPPGTPAKTLLDARSGLFRSRYKDFEMAADRPRQVHGLAGHTIEFRRAPGEGESGPMSTTEVTWTRGPFGYLANLIAEQEDHARYLADFNALVDSFEPLEEK